ncbi:MAG: TPM domain-containing protein [Flavobacteriales bacterium]|nr:TPM domain-containing protein [Flavobacteriales bacterium]
MSSSLLTGLLGVFLLACTSPTRPTQLFVYDHEGILDTSSMIRLDTLLSGHEHRTGNEVVLVTHPTFHGKTPVEFAVAFGDSLGVGKKGYDNGVVIAFSSARREVFIATGKGTVRVLHDSICQRIINTEMRTRFKEGDAYGGLLAGSKAVIDFLERRENRIRSR